MGGIIAQDGFDYQLWDGLVRLPAWLVDPAFEEIIFEGLEDMEARFFAPQAPRGRLLERFQAKAGSLSPSEVCEVLESFFSFEKAYPQASRVHTLVTPRMPPTLAWLARDPARVRKARPFYEPFDDMAAASDAELRRRLVQTYGAPLGEFVATSVDVSERNLPDQDAAVAQFDTELARAFPTLDANRRRVGEAFAALAELVRRSIGVPLGAGTLVHTIERVLGESLPIPTVFPLHIRSDRNEAQVSALQINAANFSGGPVGFPPTTEWTNLIAALDSTSRWLRGRGVSRVRIGGSYRLTTAIALGFSFRAATGFELEVPTRSGPWVTDDRPGSDDAAPTWLVEEPATLHEGRLIVSIGVLRDPAADLMRVGIPSKSMLRLHVSDPLQSGRIAQIAVATAKRAIDSAKTRLRPEQIDLFFAGPAAFAVLLGHRWNAMGRTQWHEFVPSDGQYVATALL
ncbi:SAVED domain-containing protein [Bradyrhizobium yuanmingense]|uniref:SAVED domain-containing protein n=1 Tax=Bradyrhizobium yuanmingense TaxID=108015 RepID=UPI0023B9F75E|nr:SAVED domain-containing protein [Bradyrhizobium yuanmingense]MDF0498160.1 SAVED domain-containing protein [Bradyrhizobium yuanmingense]